MKPPPRTGPPAHRDASGPVSDDRAAGCTGPEGALDAPARGALVPAPLEHGAPRFAGGEPRLDPERVVRARDLDLALDRHRPRAAPELGALLDRRARAQR